jgi:hypothetical protein
MNGEKESGPLLGHNIAFPKKKFSSLHTSAQKEATQYSKMLTFTYKNTQ